jgi:hypothetical protein
VSDRDDALRALDADDPELSARGARTLIQHPEWWNGPAPTALIERLVDPGLPPENPFLDLARLWPRRELSPHLLAAFTSADDPAQRERAAWRLKDLAGADEVPQLLTSALRTHDSPTVRRYLLEAVERLAYGQAPAWHGIGGALEGLADDPEFLVRDAAVAIASALEDSPEQRTFLLRRLDDADPIVLLSTLLALHERGMRRGDLGASVVQRLETHADPRVSAAFRQLAA